MNLCTTCSNDIGAPGKFCTACWDKVPTRHQKRYTAAAAALRASKGKPVTTKLNLIKEFDTALGHCVAWIQRPTPKLQTQKEK